jgi:hypothetical protein
MNEGIQVSIDGQPQLVLRRLARALILLVAEQGEAADSGAESDHG